MADESVLIADSHRTIPPVTRTQKVLRPFWVLPALIAVAAVLAALLMPWIDARVAIDWTVPGSAANARELLSTIASAMISVTGVVFSITMVVMQLASSQFTPRMLGGFLSRRITQWTLGVFLASFIYALTVLRAIPDADSAQEVPQLAVAVAYLLVLASMALFLAFIKTVTSMVQVTQVISDLGDTTVAQIEDYFVDADTTQRTGTWGPVGEPHTVVCGETHGYVAAIDEQRLLRFAHDNDLWIDSLVRPGDFIAQGTAVAHVWGAAPEGVREDGAEKINSHILTSYSRSMTQDPRFGVRQLVDIADRALSAAINDPTTALDVIRELRRVLGTAVQMHNPATFSRMTRTSCACTFPARL